MNMEEYPKRKSPRLKGYDYSSTNYYFVTVCTKDKKCLFGKPGELNALGKIVMFAIEMIPDHYLGVKLDQYVVMPNHVHLLLYLPEEIGKLGDIVGGMKSYATKQAHKIYPDLIIWQASYHDHIIRDEKGYQNIWLYIESNPVNWKKDCFYQE